MKWVKAETSTNDISVEKKNENSIGSLNAELSDPLLSDFFDDRYKLLLILTCCALINISVNENQKYK